VDGRRSTTATEPVGAEDHVDDDVVADRLRSLGYTEGA
jgi:hypothetical protein